MGIQHGYYNTRLYKIWSEMKDRCKHKKNNAKYYYSKGIKYDNSWEDFRNFLKDMGTGYSDNLTLDRINNTKNYSKENCRWATPTQQARNRSNNFLIKGKTLSEWSEVTEIKRSTLAQRYYVYGWSVDKVLSTIK